MKKGLIFGGLALVIGVGAYMWYKNSLKKISEEFKPSADTKTGSSTAFKKGIEDKLALGISTNQIAITESHNYGSKGITSTSFGNKTQYGA